MNSPAVVLRYSVKNQLRGFLPPSPTFFNLSFILLRNSAFYPFKCLHWEFCLTCNQERILRVGSWDLCTCIKGKTTGSFRTWTRGGNNELCFRTGDLGAIELIQTKVKTPKQVSFPAFIWIDGTFCIFCNWNVSNLNSLKLVSYLLLPCTRVWNGRCNT